MKLAIAALLCTIVTAQDQPAGELKHIYVAIAKGGRPFAVTAMQIDRLAQYPSIIRLKGNVEIKMPVCTAAPLQATQTCAGEIVFHSNEADLDEATGRIEANGPSHITRE